MADTETPRLGMRYIQAGQSKAEVTHNEAMNVLDMIVGRRALDRNLTAPPSTPSNGDTYLVASSSASGAWLGRENDITAYYNGWIFATPIEGLPFFIDDEDCMVVWTGSAWVVGEVAANGTSITDPPTKSEVESLQTTINAIITNLQTVKVFK